MKLKQFFIVAVKPIKINKTLERLGKLPSKYLLSPVLKEQNDINPQELKEQTGLDFQYQYQPNKVGRQNHYFLTQEQYKEFAYKNPHGKVHIFNYQDVNFTLAGSQWEHIPIKNLYKLLLFSRPSLIMLQMKPDQILKGFDYKFKSSKDYINQIIRNPDEIMPAGYHEKIAEALQHDKLEFLEYEPYINKERIDYDKIATISYFAKKFNAKIMLADIPALIFRETLCNQLTLPQLQQYFQIACMATPQNPDIIPNTPMNVAYQILPHIFLKRSDEFMTTLIEYLAAKKSYKRVFGILGNMQSDAIVNLLDNKSASHLRYELEIPKIKKTLFKDLTCEDLIERHAILDVMYYGDIEEEIDPEQQDYYFPETMAIIDKYADPQFIDKTRPAQMRYLHLEMLKKYSIFQQKYYKMGKSKLKEEYMEKANLV
ncbi:unnamed protein product [Paramecium primaurelia]|uniref:Uncharacterized protein n=1 Tax=Paramecium primaurelia TaxID=5886 RepID=A0A8S1L8E5_PARPR|nr:unnamed protein product [Paramecium primaurelia]